MIQRRVYVMPEPVFWQFEFSLPHSMGPVSQNLSALIFV
jgi:hypothetical protein